MSLHFQLDLDVSQRVLRNRAIDNIPLTTTVAIATVTGGKFAQPDVMPQPPSYSEVCVYYQHYCNYYYYFYSYCYFCYFQFWFIVVTWCRMLVSTDAISYAVLNFIIVKTSGKLNNKSFLIKMIHE